MKYLQSFVEFVTGTQLLAEYAFLIAEASTFTALFLNLPKQEGCFVLAADFWDGGFVTYSCIERRQFYPFCFKCMPHRVCDKSIIEI